MFSRNRARPMDRLTSPSRSLPSFNGVWASKVHCFSFSSFYRPVLLKRDESRFQLGCCGKRDFCLWVNMLWRHDKIRLARRFVKNRASQAFAAPSTMIFYKIKIPLCIVNDYFFTFESASSSSLNSEAIIFPLYPLISMLSCLANTVQNDVKILMFSPYFHLSFLL